jgi:hypothetical protein
MASAESKLTLTIRAVDKATAQLRAVNARIQEITAPARKLSNSFAALSGEAKLDKVAEGFRGVGRAMGNVKDEAFALGTKLLAIGAAAAFGLFGIVRSTVDAGDKLSEMSTRVGLTADAYSKLQFAAAQADIEQEDFNSGMDQFSKRLGEVKAGTGPLLAFLEKVSPKLAEQVKHSKGVGDAVNIMSRAFEKVVDPQKRAALSAAAFGKSGLQWGTFLGQGPKALAALGDKFTELAGSQEDFAQKSSDLDNVMRESEVAFLGARNAMAVQLYPAITQVSQGVTKFLVAHREGLTKWAEKTGAAISAWVEGGGLERLGASLISIADSVGKVVDTLGGFQNASLVALGIMSGPLISSVVKLGGALWNLGSAVLPLLLRGWALLGPALGAAGDALAGLLIAGAPVLVPLIAMLAGLGAAGKAIYDNWEPLKETFEGVVQALKEIASSGFMGGWGKLGSAITGSYDAAPAFKGLPASSMRFAPLGADGAAAPGAASHTAVTVKFDGLPPGARVTQESKGPVLPTIDLGYSMWSPQ